MTAASVAIEDERAWRERLTPGRTVLVEVELLTHAGGDLTQIEVAGYASGGRLIQSFWVPTAKLRRVG